MMTPNRPTKMMLPPTTRSAEAPSLKIASLVCWLVCAALLVGACSQRGAVATTGANRLAALEDQVHRAVDTQRGKKKLVGLKRLEDLDRIARDHSLRMAQGKVSFGHKHFKRRAEQAQETVSARTVAENVARNQGYGDPASVAMTGWMKSRGHRRNILGTYTSTGVGAALASDGTVYITQLFATTSATANSGN